MKNKKSLKGYILVAMAGSCWGVGGFFVTKMSAMGISSLMTAFTGQALAVFPLLIFILSKKGLKGLKISRRGLLFSFLLGVLTKGLFKLCLDTSMVLIGVSTATILIYLAPLWAAIMAMIFLKEKLRGYQNIALILNLIGCILMVTRGNFTELNISAQGLTLGIIAGFLFGLSSILGKIGTSEDNSVTMTFYMLLFSGVTTAIFARPWEHLYLLGNSSFLVWASVNAIVTGTLANLFFLKGLSMGIDASKATIVASIEVIVASLAGILLLNEHINLIGFIGILIMFTSIVLMNLNPAENRGEKKKEIIA